MFTIHATQSVIDFLIEYPKYEYTSILPKNMNIHPSNTESWIYISQIRKIIIVKTITNNLCNAYGQHRNLIASVKITWTK